MGETPQIDTGIQELVNALNVCNRWETIASCQGHPEDPERDHAFVTLELKAKDLRDYDFFHSLLNHEIHVSFGRDNRIILSHPWRQYGEYPTEDQKREYNGRFIERALALFSEHIGLTKE